MMKAWQDNVYFVLVEPKEPGNIGASARAIKNMGFRNLCLVSPPPEMTTEGSWFARNAHDVLDSAVIYPSVADAIKDKAIVVGTTRRRGKSRGVIMPAGEGASKIFRMAVNNKVAILFGREARGLSNEEVEECGFMLTIPSSRLQPSLNLSHAVLIIAYELFLAEPGGPEAGGGRGSHIIPQGTAAPPGLQGHGEIADLYESISVTLELLEYIPRGDRNIRKRTMANLKHFIGRAGLTDWELKTLRGLCYQIGKKVGRQ
ncbi:MAG TPA: RNA methyltransferase [Thermodesulfovibrionales bacterium]|nr:RNA methyltransferase [Thermodesulfovibrionales bacterium]